MTAGSHRRRRRGLVLSVVIVVAALVTGIGALVLTPRTTAARPSGTPQGTVWSMRDMKAEQPLVSFPSLPSLPSLPSFPSTKPRPPRARVAPTTVSYVARLSTDEPGYDRPGGKVVTTVPGSWYGIPSMLLVMQRAPGGWLHVRLAQRPDESTAWIRSDGVKLSTTPYKIVVNLTTTHVEVYKLGKLLYDFPAGVGAPGDPTPTGKFFVVFLEPPPDASYGPFVMYTSAHSNAIQDWAGSGDAIIAIHGPIGADAEIGTTGAYISHGCIRLHVADQVKLAMVPPGTPVDIVA